MASPALILANLLQSVPKHEKQKKLIWALSENLSIKSGVVEDQIVIHVRGLVVSCHEIIDRLSFPEDQKSIARSFLSSMEGFKQYSAFGYTVEQADNPILQPATISGLRTLDMIISPHLHRKGDLNPEVSEAVEVLREALSIISEIDFPEALLRLLQKRLLQVIEAMEHHSFFGEEEIQVRLDALIGQVALATTGKSGAAKAWAKRIVSATAIIGAGIVGLNQVADAYIGLKNKYPEISKDFIQESK